MPRSRSLDYFLYSVCKVAGFFIPSAKKRRILRERFKRIDTWDSSNTIVVVEPDGSRHPVVYAADLPNVKFSCLAKNCRVVFHKPFLMKDLMVNIWDGCDNSDIEIGANLATMEFLISAVDKNGKLRIGDMCAVMDTEIVLSGGECVIGNNCLFSAGVKIYTHDTHSLVDPDTLELLNGNARGVHIGPYSWIGRNALFTKNANVAAHTVVAMGAVVTKTFDEEFISVGGNPATRLGKCGLLDPRRESQYLEDMERARKKAAAK